ncbi:hypothetical protein QQ008_11995 [Fulvivirgaceae bacterium BMA10]|uniref:Uncharacterized protein n=1 Tax=Splendidivirga corallicola TaxID=3051826 RepID=A0ABT8KRH9_9BACT|nr:hypothetical protein [Fulvivirgaceae bacterium BMA10]
MKESSTKLLNKRFLIKLVAEVATVVFAVLLALGLNSWKENKANRDEAAKALDNIVREVEANLKSLKSNIAVNDEKLPELKIMEDSLENHDKVDSYGVGYDQTFLNEAAWNAANATGSIKHFDYETIHELSEIYQLQTFYSRYGDNFFELAVSPDFYNADRALELVKSNITLIRISNSAGNSLVRLYQDFLAAHGKMEKAQKETESN